MTRRGGNHLDHVARHWANQAAEALFQASRLQP